MSLLQELLDRSDNPDTPFLVGGDQSLSLRTLAETPAPCADIAPGEVVALIGDVDAPSIAALLALADRGAVVMPLSEASAAQHERSEEHTSELQSQR